MHTSKTKRKQRGFNPHILQKKLKTKIIIKRHLKSIKSVFEPRQVLNSVCFCSIKWLPPRWDACPWQDYISPSWSVNSLDLHVYIHWGGVGKVPCPRPQYNDPCQASNREQFIRSSASYKPYGNGIFTLHHLKDM